MSDDTKPDGCPFCGSTDRPRVADFEGALDGFPGYCVVCDASGLDGDPRNGCGASTGWAARPAQAVAKWNRRAPVAVETGEPRHLTPEEKDAIGAALRKSTTLIAPASSPPPLDPDNPENEQLRKLLDAAEAEAEEAYKIGVDDGYEDAIQAIDMATGGDGEFRGSTIPGRTVDVPTMQERIIERFRKLAAARDEIPAPPPLDPRDPDVIIDPQTGEMRRREG